MAKDIENKMPKIFDLDQVRKHLGLNISPTSVVLLQELGRFNKLVIRMTRSLAELQRVSVSPGLGSPSGSGELLVLRSLAEEPPSCRQALAGEVGMSNELDDVARSLFLGHIPHIWRKLAPDTLKTLGNWMVYFLRRFNQYTLWVSAGATVGLSLATSPHLVPSVDPCECILGVPGITLQLPRGQSCARNAFGSLTCSCDDFF